MPIDLGGADAGVALGVWIIDDFLQELIRRGDIPLEYEYERPLADGEPLGELLGITLPTTPLLLRLNVTLDPPPRFEFVRPETGDPYTRLTLEGRIDVRLASADPSSAPLQSFPLRAPARLALVLHQVTPDSVKVVTLAYQGTDGPPDPPVTEEDIDRVFDDPKIKAKLTATKIDLAAPLITGLNASRFPLEAGRPKDAEWDVKLTLMPARDDTDDAFFVTVAPPGASAAPKFRDSFLRSKTGMGVAFSRAFLDLMLERGADAKEGKPLEDVEDATLRSLELRMHNTAIFVRGHIEREVTIPHVEIELPTVDIHFKGPMVPRLVRGTTIMVFDVDGVDVWVDQDDEVFYNLLKWFLTIASSVLFFTGSGAAAAVGIASWVLLVPEAWNGEVEIQNAPNTVRDGLANVLGAEMSALADSLDDDREVDPMRVDATPDSLEVVDGNILLYAQILLIPLQDRLRLAEFSTSLKRFGIMQLRDGRRFRTQELARLMQRGKVFLPGFHPVDGRYVRANPDDADANNLLEMFKSRETNEAVL